MEADEEDPIQVRPEHAYLRSLQVSGVLEIQGVGTGEAPVKRERGVHIENLFVEREDQEDRRSNVMVDIKLIQGDWP